MKQRKYFRKFYGANASLWIQNREHNCIVKDISRSSALLTFDARPPVKIGELVDIQIPFTDGERHVQKTAKVKRISGNSIGIRFYGGTSEKSTPSGEQDASRTGRLCAADQHAVSFNLIRQLAT